MRKDENQKEGIYPQNEGHDIIYVKRKIIISLSSFRSKTYKEIAQGIQLSVIQTQ